MGTGRHQIAHFLDPHHNADTFDSALFWTPAGFLSQYYDVITLRWQRAWGLTLGLEPYLFNELPHANNSPAMITRSLLPTMGPGGPQSCISNFRNDYITVTVFANFRFYFKQAHTNGKFRKLPVSYWLFFSCRKASCRMLVLRNGCVALLN